MQEAFITTSRIWKDIPFDRAIFIHDLKNPINKHINLNQYGTGLHFYNFTAVIEPEAFFPDKHHYLVKEKCFEAEIRMDFAAVKDANLAAFQTMVVQSFLTTVDWLGQLQLEHFNARQLRNDLTALFTKKGWLE